MLICPIRITSLEYIRTSMQSARPSFQMFLLRVVQLEVACKFMNAPLDQPVVLLYQSTDSGNNWEKKEIPAGNLTYLPESGLLVQGAVTSILRDTQKKWTELSDVPEGISTQFISKDTGWILSTTGEIYMTTDGGLIWGIISPQLDE